jgi:short-subunit dehydrogenase
MESKTVGNMSNKIALVTWANKGIGLQIAKDLTARDGDVSLSARGRYAPG